MSRTYKATGINLKSMPMGESDRLLTILTREYGLIRAIAMGSRKHNSRLGGRSELFVVNELLIAKGRTLDKVTQAETVESYPGLGQDLKKLIASQYLAELCLFQALSDQPQEELFCLLNEHLERLEKSSASNVLAHLTHAVFQLLVLAGISPQVHTCCVTRQPLIPDLANPSWQAGFSIPAGGAVTLAALEQLLNQKQTQRLPGADQLKNSTVAYSKVVRDRQTMAAEVEAGYGNPVRLNMRLMAPELALLQRLAEAILPEVETAASLKVSHSLTASISETKHAIEKVWCSVERILRHYAQYHFDRSIRSATLIDACFATSAPS